MNLISGKKITRIILVIVLSLVICPWTYSQDNCDAGALLYYEKNDSIFLLLADHLVARDRGWASFGGTCIDDNTETTAVQEVIEESRGYYIIEGKLDDDLKVVTNDFTTYLVKVDPADIDSLNGLPFFCKQTKCKERGPYQEFSLSKLSNLIEKYGWKERVILKDSFDLPSASSTAYLYKEFLVALRAIYKLEPFKEYEPNIPNQSSIKNPGTKKDRPNKANPKKTIVLNYDPVSSGLTHSNKKGLRAGRSYQVYLNGIHTAFQSPKGKAENFIQVSSAPDVIKFLGISTNEAFGMTQSSIEIPNEDENKLKKRIKDNIKTLDTILSFLSDSEKLHSQILKKWKDQSSSNYYKEEALKADSIAKEYDLIFQELDLQKSIEKYGILLQSFLVTKAVVESQLEEGVSDLEILGSYTKFLFKLGSVESSSSKMVRAIRFIINTAKTKNDLAKPKAFTSTTLNKFKAGGDRVELKVSLIDNYSLDTLINQKVNFPTYNRLRFDFSTGFYYNQLKNFSYSSMPHPTDTTRVLLTRDDDNTIDVAIGGQLHLTYKFTSRIGGGINVGAAVSPFDGKTRYLAGFHIMTGESKQLMISGGWALARVKRFSDAITGIGDEEATMIELPVEFAEPKLVDKFRSSVFIGVSYNLSSVFKSDK